MAVLTNQARESQHDLVADDLYPRDAEHRYRIYALRGKDDLEVLATSSTPGGIGMALVTLHEDEKARGQRLADRGRIGVLDVLAGGPTGEWILLPWVRRTKDLTYGPNAKPIKEKR